MSNDHGEIWRDIENDMSALQHASAELVKRGKKIKDLEKVVAALREELAANDKFLLSILPEFEAAAEENRKLVIAAKAAKQFLANLEKEGVVI